MQLILVYNPKSGSALTRRELRAKCDAAGIHIEKIIPIKDGFERALAPHIKKGKLIAVIGGDGTISAVAGLVAGTKAVLIPLPGGTLNHFTKDADIPQNVDEALGRLSTLKPRQVDIAIVNDTHFINNSSIGIYPATLRDREEIQSTIGKWPAAVAASIRAFVRLRTYTVTIDNTSTKTPFIFVGNNRYSLASIGGTKRTAIDKGDLTVFVAKTQSRLTLLKIALFTIIGKSADVPELEVFYTSTLTIHAKRHQLSVSHDGEVSRLATPLRYQIKPKSLTILG